MRRYCDPVEVRKGMVGELEAPEQFLWHGRLWKVRGVLAHWVETGPWWQSSGVRAVIGSDEPHLVGAGRDGAGRDGAGRDGAGSASFSGLSADLLAERELWRVEAGRPDRTGTTTAVFDLSFDWSDGNWQLVGCSD